MIFNRPVSGNCRTHKSTVLVTAFLSKCNNRVSTFVRKEEKPKQNTIRMEVLVRPTEIETSGDRHRANNSDLYPFYWKVSGDAIRGQPFPENESQPTPRVPDDLTRYAMWLYLAVSYGVYIRQKCVCRQIAKDNKLTNGAIRRQWTNGTNDGGNCM